MPKKRTKAADIGTTGQPAVVTPVLQACEGTSDDSTAESLKRLAAELGKLLARATMDRRRGYGLHELLYGLMICALFVVLLSYLLRWLL